MVNIFNFFLLQCIPTSDKPCQVRLDFFAFRFGLNNDETFKILSDVQISNKDIFSRIKDKTSQKSIKNNLKRIDKKLQKRIEIMNEGLEQKITESHNALLIESNTTDLRSDCSFKDQLIVSGCNDTLFTTNKGVER